MKPKIALFALPFALGASLLSANGQERNPTPTKEDVQIRAYLSQFPKVEFMHAPSLHKKRVPFLYESLSSKEFSALISNLYLSPEPAKLNWVTRGHNGFFAIACPIDKSRQNEAFIKLDVVAQRGQILFAQQGIKKTRDFTPTAAKRWIELLLASPRIGPQLRARIR